MSAHVSLYIMEVEAKGRIVPEGIFVNYRQTIVIVSIDIYLSTGMERSGVPGRFIDSSVIASGRTIEIRRQ